MAFGETLANLRKMKGLSQEQLAEEIDLTRQTISKWETNQSTPDIDYILQLSEFFNVSTDYLIKGEYDDSHVSQHKDSSFQSLPEKVCCGNDRKRFLYIGPVLSAVSLCGIIAFVICSSLNPWTAIVENRVYEGVWGFLIGTETLWFFVVLCVIFILGLSLSVFGLIGRKK